MSHDTRSMLSCCVAARFQSTQEIGSSWQYALLLPYWVRPNSSPPNSIGVPAETKSVVSRLRWERWRSPAIVVSCKMVKGVRALGWVAEAARVPSTPWFHDLLSFEPSRLPSRFAILCLRS